MFSVCFLRCAHGTGGQAIISCPPCRWPRHGFPVASAVCVTRFGCTLDRFIFRYAGGVADASSIVWLFDSIEYLMIVCSALYCCVLLRVPWEGNDVHGPRRSTNGWICLLCLSGWYSRGGLSHCMLLFMLDHSIVAARSTKVFLRFLTRRFLILLILASMYREGYSIFCAPFFFFVHRFS